MDVIEVVEHFTETNKQRGQLVEADGVDRLNGKVAEEYLSWNLI